MHRQSDPGRRVRKWRRVWRTNPYACWPHLVKRSLPASIPGALIEDANGNFFTTLSSGGPYNSGLAIRLSPPAKELGRWTETNIFDFGSPSVEVSPSLSVVDARGDLYGTTYDGGPDAAGYVFELTPSTPGSVYSQTILYSFAGNADGSDPGELISDGKGGFYGVTQLGGGACNCGTVFALVPPRKGSGSWTKSILYAFQNDTGSSPIGRLLLGKDGSLYGVTLDGGPTANRGTAYHLTAPVRGHGPWTWHLLHAFGGPPDGTDPDGGLIADASGNLYGTTSAGGSSPYGGDGTVFELSPRVPQSKPWAETILHSFTGPASDGASTSGELLAVGTGALYGTTQVGGTGCAGEGCGTIFKMTNRHGVWGENVVYAFTGEPDGTEPFSGLVPGPFGLLYGTTTRGGRWYGGIAYALKP